MVDFIFEATAEQVGFVFGIENVILQTGGVCADATVENSDVSYTNTVASGGTLVTPDVLFSIDHSVGNYISSYYPSVKDVTVTLADTQYDIYVNGAFNQTVFLPALQDDTININAV